MLLDAFTLSMQRAPYARGDGRSRSPARANPAKITSAAVVAFMAAGQRQQVYTVNGM